MKTLLMIAAAGLLAGIPVFAAGSATITNTAYTGGYMVYTIQWTSDASGNVNGFPVTVASGTFAQARIVPSAVSAPTDLYDATLVDDASVDLLAGAGADLSATAGKYIRESTGQGLIIYSINQTIELRITNAGNTKAGRIDIWIKAAI